MYIDARSQTSSYNYVLSLTLYLIPREPNPGAKDAKIPVDKLPKCKKEGCKGLVRPHVVWFGEGLDRDVLRQTNEELDNCDLCLVVSLKKLSLLANGKT